jgi:biopolymer transport protein TolR
MGLATDVHQRMMRDRAMGMIGSLESTTVNVSPRWRSKSRSNQLICYINMTGLVSIMLTLLFMFMVIRSNEHPHRGVIVDLAKVNHSKTLVHADAEDALAIGVLRDGKVFFRTDLVRPEDLPVRIRDAIAHGAENKVYIRADARARFVSVKDVLDAVRASGVENVAFLTEQRHPPAQ